MELNEKVRKNKAVICIVGVGFVGLPLSVQFAKKGFRVFGFDVDSKKVKELKAGRDPTQEIGNDNLSGALKECDLDFTDKPEKIKQADIIIIAVPTPIDELKRPYLRYIEKASETVGKLMKKGSVIVLESSVYPGVTEDVVKPILERESGMKCGVGFGLGYSPERINPGDADHSLTRVVKIVSAHDGKTLQLLSDLYEKIVDAGVYKTRDIKTAEAAKIIENIQRDLNIALVNELAIIFEKMGIDANEVLDAAGTKWNFHPYRPGLVGGHCIPIDPYYLVYKAKSLKYNPKIILSGRDINEYMPVHVAKMVLGNLKKYGKKPKRSNVLLLGLAFKKNVGDIRNSPSKVLIDELKKEKVKVIGWEPLMPDDILIEAFGVDIVKDIVFSKKIDCIVLVTDHDAFKDISIDKLLKISRGKPILIDVRGFFNKEMMKKAGFEYVRL